MDWYEYVCPVHGVVVRHGRTDPVPPVVPNTCSFDMYGERLRCGERLRFRMRWTTRARTVDIGGPSHPSGHSRPQWPSRPSAPVAPVVDES